MNILICGTSFDRGYGGPAASVSQLAAALAEVGARVGLWAPDGSAATSDVIPRTSEALHCLAGPLDRALTAFGPPDVVHDNGLWRPHNHNLARLARQRRLPRIVSTRGMLEPWAIRHKRLKKAVAWRLYQRRDLAAADLLHATAATEAETLAGYGLGVPAALIGNGVPLPEPSAAAPGDLAGTSERVALFLGRLHPVKGLPMLIEAWARLRPQGWRLHIAGPDECGHRAEVEAQIARHRLGGVTTMLGPLDGGQVAAAYAAAALLVLPTRSESFGMAVAEALAHGVPVLTTTAAPWPELDAVRCGWRVAPTVDGLGGGLSRATASEPVELAEMGRRGRALVAARYAWGPIARRFLAAYEEAIARAGQSGEPGRRSA